MYNNKNVHIWNKWSSIYDKLLFPTEASYANLTLKIIKSIEYTDKVLEIATGTGQVALSLSPYCKTIDAIDYSTAMISKARHNMDFLKFQNVNFSVSNAENLPYNSNTYDVVILSNALHTLENPDCVIHEIKRILKPGGKLITANFLHAENTRSMMLIHALTLIGYPIYRTFNESSYHNYLSRFDLLLKRCTIIDGIIPLAYVEASIK